MVDIGDEIIEVEGKNVHGATLRTLVELLKSLPKSDKVSMVLRRHKDSLFV